MTAARARESLRPLTPDELKLLRWILENGSEDLRSYLPQLEGLRAARSCDCGCPSIRLEAAESAPAGKLSGDRVIGDFEGKTEQRELVGVLVFQDGGKLTELEVYSMDGLAEGEFGLPTLDSMSVLEWEPSPRNPNILVPKSRP